MSEISEEEPDPGVVGLRSVVSTRVQRSPLLPQLPGGKLEDGRLYVWIIHLTNRFASKQ